MSFAGEVERAPAAPGLADGTSADVSRTDVPLDRDLFLRQLLRELAGTLENVVGLQEAAGYISVVGGAIGDKLDADYRQALGVENLTRDQVIGVLLDLKRRIEGDFFLEEDREDRVVLGNRVCPFGAHVNGRPSLCMMTSNVFGSIAAENLGYARVEIAKALALGDSGCRVIVHLKPSDSPEPGAREYFRKS